MSLLTSVDTKGIEYTVDKFTAEGVIGEVTEKEVASGNISVSFPIEYLDKEGNERTFVARYLLNPDWMELSAREAQEEGYFVFRNLVQLHGGLFKALEMDTTDLDAIEGQRVGFSAGPQKADPSRLELKSFYKPKK